MPSAKASWEPPASGPTCPSVLATVGNLAARPATRMAAFRTAFASASSSGPTLTRITVEAFVRPSVDRLNESPSRPEIWLSFKSFIRSVPRASLT
jgi:hypothetical protein